MPPRHGARRFVCPAHRGPARSRRNRSRDATPPDAAGHGPARPCGLGGHHLRIVSSRDGPDDLQTSSRKDAGCCRSCPRGGSTTTSPREASTKTHRGPHGPACPPGVATTPGPAEDGTILGPHGDGMLLGPHGDGMLLGPHGDGTAPGRAPCAPAPRLGSDRCARRLPCCCTAPPAAAAGSQMFCLCCRTSCHESYGQRSSAHRAPLGRRRARCWCGTNARQHPSHRCGSPRCRDGCSANRTRPSDPPGRPVAPLGLPGCRVGRHGSPACPGGLPRWTCRPWDCRDTRPPLEHRPQTCCGARLHRRHALHRNGWLRSRCSSRQPLALSCGGQNDRGDPRRDPLESRRCVRPHLVCSRRHPAVDLH